MGVECPVIINKRPGRRATILALLKQQK